jgi:hypothetical protein
MALLARHWIARVMAIACALSVGGCSAASTATRPVVSVRSEDILLLPPEEAGEAGWCMKTGATITGCTAYTLARLPIVAESWSGEGEGSDHWIRGFALTTGEVTGVVLKGQAVPTHAETMLPDGLRAVSVIFRGKGPSHGEPFPRLRPLDAQGRVMPTRRGGPLITWTEPIRFSNVNHPTMGACHIAAGLIAGPRRRRRKRGVQDPVLSKSSGRRVASVRGLVVCHQWAAFSRHRAAQCCTPRVYACVASSRTTAARPSGGI